MWNEERIRDGLERRLSGLGASAERRARIRDAAPGTIAAEEKTGPQDLVTNYDRQVQENLERGLRQLRPGAGFLGEEGLRVPPAGHTGEFFIIDPIDGTMNFARDYRRSCISVALADETGVRFGAVYDPYQDEYFCAERGRGAMRNGRPLRVSDRPLDRAIVMFGTAPYDRGVADRTFALARRFFDRGLDLRRSGSAAGRCVLPPGARATSPERPKPVWSTATPTATELWAGWGWRPPEDMAGNGLWWRANIRREAWRALPSASATEPPAPAC